MEILILEPLLNCMHLQWPVHPYWYTGTVWVAIQTQYGQCNLFVWYRTVPILSRICMLLLSLLGKMPVPGKGPNPLSFPCSISSQLHQWPGGDLHAGPSCTIPTGVFPADISLGVPGSAARAVLLLVPWRTATVRRRGKQKTKFEMAILLQCREVTLCDCRVCVLSWHLFKRMTCGVGESRNTTSSESNSGSEQQQRAEAFSSRAALELGHSKCSKGKTELAKALSGSTCGKLAAGCILEVYGSFSLKRGKISHMSKAPQEVCTYDLQNTWYVDPSTCTPQNYLQMLFLTAHPLMP